MSAHCGSMEACCTASSRMPCSSSTSGSSSSSSPGRSWSCAGRGWFGSTPPTALWGILVEWSGWICPLTPLENRLRAQGGAAGYPGGFVEHYLVPVLYPASLTHSVQVLLGATVLVVNLIAYAIVFARTAAARRS